MQTVPQTICDRCGRSQTYIQAKATNGMVAYTWDLCKWCFDDVKAMMLNQNNRFRKVENED